MKNKKIILGIVIIIIFTLVGTIGVIASNLKQKPAKPASESGEYIQNTTTEVEKENCCGGMMEENK